MTEASRLLPGTRILAFRIVRVLGSGGMGVVYEAHDETLNRTVALKVLNPDLVRNRASRDALTEEARLSASLDHPGIVTIYALTQVDELAVLVMERVDGESLAERLASGWRAGPLEAARIMLGVAGAIHAAHQRGVLHLDLKPANVMITGDGRTKVLDFGIGRSLGSVTPSASSVIRGTPAYMAPEQLAGLPVTDRTDVWSLGAMGAALVLGRSPFAGGAQEAGGDATLAGAPPSLQDPSDLALVGPLLPIVRRCFLPTPGERISLPELTTALQALLQGEEREPAVARRGTEMRSRRAVVSVGLALGATCLVLAVALGGWLATRSPTRAREMAAVTIAPRPEPPAVPAQPPVHRATEPPPVLSHDPPNHSPGQVPAPGAVRSPVSMSQTEPTVPKPSTDTEVLQPVHPAAGPGGLWQISTARVHEAMAPLFESLLRGTRARTESLLSGGAGRPRLLQDLERATVTQVVPGTVDLRGEREAAVVAQVTFSAEGRTWARNLYFDVRFDENGRVLLIDALPGF